MSKTGKVLPVVSAVILAALALAPAAFAQTPTTSPDSAPAGTVAAECPFLTSGGLSYARLAELPDGVLLRAGEATLTREDLEADIAKAPQDMQEPLRRNAFFLLEQRAMRVLLLREARALAAQQGRQTAELSEEALLRGLLDHLTEPAKVDDEQVAAFYQQNRDLFGAARLEQVRKVIADMLLNEKRQALVRAHMRTLGQRTAVEVSAEWVKRQAPLALDNPVDKARAGGLPSLVDFGAHGCIPCDQLAPILEVLREKYQGRANVVFVSVHDEPLLAARYGIESIPVQIFFDRQGREVFRHSGFWPQEQLEARLAEAGAEQQ